ncbi:unnamed protein product, partial [Symbiodinium sp. KB8]
QRLLFSDVEAPSPEFSTQSHQLAQAIRDDVQSECSRRIAHRLKVTLFGLKGLWLFGKASEACLALLARPPKVAQAKLIAPLSVLVSTRSSVANVMGSFMLTFVNRRITNAAADKLCNTFASKLNAEDVQFKRNLELLSIRAANAYPCFQAYERSKEAKKRSYRDCTGDEPRLCKKRPGANIGYGHTQTTHEWFNDLIKGNVADAANRHEWKWQGLDVVCNLCSLRLLHSKNRKVIAARALTPCGADGPARFTGVHESHNLVLKGQLWFCTKCGGQYSLTKGTVSAKLKACCTQRMDKRSKMWPEEPGGD